MRNVSMSIFGYSVLTQPEITMLCYHWANEPITRFGQPDGQTNDTIPSHLKWIEEICIYQSDIEHGGEGNWLL